MLLTYGLTIGLITVLNEQPLFVQTTVLNEQTDRSTRLSNRLYNPVWQPVWQPAVYTIQPFVKLVWQLVW